MICLELLLKNVFVSVGLIFEMNDRRVEGVEFVIFSGVRLKVFCKVYYYVFKIYDSCE